LLFASRKRPGKTCLVFLYSPPFNRPIPLSIIVYLICSFPVLLLLIIFYPDLLCSANHDEWHFPRRVVLSSGYLIISILNFIRNGQAAGNFFIPPQFFHLQVSCNVFQVFPAGNGIVLRIFKDGPDKQCEFGKIVSRLFFLICLDQVIIELRQLKIKCGFICARNAIISVSAMVCFISASCRAAFNLLRKTSKLTR